MRTVYLDHAATTPVRPEVIDVMVNVLTEAFGNPSSGHQFGRPVRKLIEQARQQTAQAINARPQEVFFTSGGTEADNLAILGAARANANRGKHLITNTIEHHAVLDAFSHLKREGFEVTVLPVDEYGFVSIETFLKALREDTVLVSIMHANNEIGTINPIAEIGCICREQGILFHTDAVQSVGKIPVDVQALNVDLLTLTGHKIYGPKGVGALYVRGGVQIAPLVHGGGQEKAIRPGTENVTGIVALGKALEVAVEELEEESKRLAGLRDNLIQGVMDGIPNSRLNGHPTERLPHNVNFSFPGLDGQMLIQQLERKGIAASAGSACTSDSVEPSHVLRGIGLERGTALGSVRLSLGKSTTEEDIDYVIAQLKESVALLQR
ncbi:cysteine desulfurase NifS [Effusibacillus consociatus]|uniref:Cysteine desulfurase n=1 Tax=Effusibacillus consociatus TaxID=1117041 RepID=A0ABV9Q3D1_9BACL